MRVEGDIVTLRMCAGSKSFCAIENFASASARTCGVHLSWPSAADSAKGGGRKRSRTAAAPVKAAPGAPVAASDPDFEAMNLRAEARRKAKAAEAAMFGEPDGQPTPVVSASAVSDAHQPPLCSQHVSHACAAWPVQQARRAA